MKKWICLLLAVLLAVSLCACGSSAAQGENGGELKKGQLLVGYGKVNITPELSLPLAGYGNTETRMSEGFRDYLFATCFAVTDADGNTAILFGVDMTSSGYQLFVTAREKISEKHGIPMDRIIMSASHNHSAPDMGNTKVASVGKWAPELIELLVKCADKAMEDRAPAEMYTTIVETERLNFVRRYKLEDGTVNGYQSIIQSSGLAIVGHETEPDRTLRLLKFEREDKNDILVANFQTHPHREGSATNPLMTADLVGAFRDEVTAKLGYDVVYFTGAAGNINPSSLVKEENITKDYKEQGKALAKYAIDADSTYTKVNGGAVRGTSEVFESKIDHTEDHLLNIAREAQEMWKETNNIMQVTNAYAEYGINGPYHANAIISKASKGQSDNFEIFAVSFGDVGFACAPYEMFDTNGSFIKENSPFPITFVAECANGANGYFPSEGAWDNGGYEVDTCRYMKGTAEALADRFVAMLETLYAAK